MKPQEIKGGCKKNVRGRIFSWVGENERLSTSGPIRCRGVEKAANSSHGGRRPVWATPRFLNGLGGLDYCLNRSPQPPAAELADRARRVFTSVRAVCEWRRCRVPLPAHAEMPGTVIPVAGLGECLRRIQKSVRRWNRLLWEAGSLPPGMTNSVRAPVTARYAASPPPDTSARPHCPGAVRSPPTGDGRELEPHVGDRGQCRLRLPPGD